MVDERTPMELQNGPPSPARAPRRRVGMERCLIGLTVLLLATSVTLIVALVMVVTPAAKAAPSPPAAANTSLHDEASRRIMASAPEQELCVSPGCVRLASHLLTYRDGGRQPCVDFFQHACGGWQRRAEQLGLADAELGFNVNVDQVERAVDWKIRQLLVAPRHDSVHGFLMAQNFYKYCMEVLPATKFDLEPSADHILSHVLGGFQSAAGWAAAPSSGDLTSLLVRLHRLLGAPLFELSRTVDPRDHGRRAFVVAPPTFDPLESAGSSRYLLGRARPRNLWLQRHLQRRQRYQNPQVLGGVDSKLDAAQDAASQSHQQQQEILQEPVEGSLLFSLITTTVIEEHLKNSLAFFRSYIVVNNMTSEFDERDMQEVSHFLTTLSSLMPSHQERAAAEVSEHLTYQHPTTVDELQDNYSFVNWSRLLSEVLRTQADSSDVVYLKHPTYIDDLGVMLDIFSPRIVHNSLLLLYRMEHLEALIADLAAANEDKNKRQGFCSELTITIFPVSVAGMFVRDAGHARLETLKSKVSTLLEEVQHELIQSIERKAALSSSELYTRAAQKVRSVRAMVVASDQFWRDDFINEHTPSFPPSRPGQGLTESDASRPRRHHLLQLMRSLRTVQNFLSRKHLDNTASSEDTIWSYVVEPFRPNAFYLSHRNTVVIPLGFLTEPNFYDDVPQYITHALLGGVLAHELLHSIGVEGMYTGHNGTFEGLSPADEAELRRLRSCVRHTYAGNLSRVVHLNGVGIGVQPDAELTLDENLSDHDGLALTWSTYRRWQRSHGREKSLPGVTLSVEQTFILSLAQTFCSSITPLGYVTSSLMSSHMTNPERVNAMARHWPEFAAAFDCPEGSPMYPRERCDAIW